MNKTILLIILIIMSASFIYANTRQGNWVWRWDDGSESEATTIAVENNAFTLNNYNNIRLRVELYNNDPDFGTNTILSLFYSTQPFPNVNDWTKITAENTENAFVLGLSDNFADGDDAPTDMLSQTSGSHAAGIMTESSSDRLIQIAANSSEEYEYCIQATTNIALNTTYYFTVRESGGTAVFGYNDLPTLTTFSSLPVELTSFTANVLSTSVRLLWKTATEVNNYGFDVERASFGHPEANPDHPRNQAQWETVGFVNGSGNSNSTKSYIFEDKQLAAGKYLYRLKQIDIDGTFKYYQEIEIELGTAPLGFNLKQNYPNPFNPETTIEFTVPETGLTTLKVFDIRGEEVAILFNQIAEAGMYNTVRFDASKLSSGIYLARLQSGNRQLMKKMTCIK